MLPKKILKPYLLKTPEYRGGKGTTEVKTKADKIYKLSSNENPIGSSPKAMEAVMETAQNLHIYPNIFLTECLCIYHFLEVPVLSCDAIFV